MVALPVGTKIGRPVLFVMLRHAPPGPVIVCAFPAASVTPPVPAVVPPVVLVCVLAPVMPLPPIWACTEDA
jgi:hypothetical protein